MKILHLSFDIPDEFIKDKTVAIQNLIHVSNKSGNENFYFTLNRCNDRKFETKVYQYEDHISIKKFGYPYGINLIQTLNGFYKEIIAQKVNINKYDIIHAHKLTYEGYIASLLSEKFNLPYIVSVRFTDFKVLKVRIDLKAKYKKVLLNSKKIFCISPWMIRELAKIFGEDFIKEIKSKIEILPNIIKNEQYEFVEKHNNRFITIFKITKANLKRKNIFRTIDAIKNIVESGEDIFLDIVGDGDGFEVLEKYIQKNKLSNNINLLGKIPNEELLSKLSPYKGFILCSYPETFGLVYIEAIIKGIPIIYTRNAGIDGFFEENKIGEAVNYKKVKDIKNSILKLMNNYNFYKQNVKLTNDSGYLKIFTEKEVGNKYEKILNTIFLN